MALAFLRRHRWWFNWFLVAIIASFIWFYIPAFQGADAGSPGETLAKVGDLPITLGQYQREFLRQRQFYDRLYQGRLDAAAIQSLGLRERVLDGLISERVVQLEARRLGLTVDEQAIRHKLETDPQFRGADGRFVGGGAIRRALEQQGTPVAEFENGLRQELLRDKLEALVADGVGVSAAEVEKEFRRRTEQVRLEYVLVEAARFRSPAAVGEEEVRTRFAAQKERYRIPERRVVSYVLVDVEALRPRVAVTDREIETYYDEHRSEFKEDEQVCARHILVKVKAGPEAKDGHAEDEAKKLAQRLLDQVKAGSDFAALAKKSSEDPGSAAGGGDLGCFPRGRMVPEFETAAFALDPGQTSALVKSSFGYHIIRVSSRKEETTQPLAQAKERIRQTVTGQRARALAEEKSQAAAEALQRGRSLEEAAREQGLAVQKGRPLARGETAEPLTSPALVARAFELSVGEIEKEPLRTPRGYVFMALSDIQPSRVPELAEIQDKVKADLLEEKALSQAQAQAAEVRAKAEKLGLEKAAGAVGLVRKETPSLTGRGQPLGDLGSGLALDEAAFGLPEKTLSDPVRARSGYAVLRVLERKAFDAAAFAKEKARIAASLREQKRSQLFQAYLAQARQRIPVERRPGAFRRVMG